MKFFSALWPLTSPLVYIVYLHYALTRPPQRQKYLLNHLEQYSPNVSKMTL